MNIYKFVIYSSPDGTPWVPKPHSRICSEHFINGKVSISPLSPNYVPTIFPPVYKKRRVNAKQALNRLKIHFILKYKNNIFIVFLRNLDMKYIHHWDLVVGASKTALDFMCSRFLTS